MSKWVISHSGKKGGPWEADGHVGCATGLRSRRMVWTDEAHVLLTVLPAVRSHHPSAKVFRLVRRPSLTTLERAVVEAALKWEAAPPGNDAAEVAVMYVAIRALRAKRGG